MVVFLSNYDPRQVKHGPKEFRRTVEAFVKFAEDADKVCGTLNLHSSSAWCKLAESPWKPIVAVKALKKAILRSANPTTFSFMHHLFAQACLKARCFRDALPVLDIDIFDFPISKSANDIELLGRGFEVTYQDVLSYYLYGGMLYHGVKNWRRAQEYLQYVGQYIRLSE